ncbi:MAG TPA: NADH:ubiquinone reductase (Na(+)-transporting) subunit B [Candidatus Coprenecus stercoripullorum]|nr:NADH:ubiquinone reductase (Na(+)-transporting) subunit B [Candidatus Coprenecus stercoripullorum]
MENKDKKRSVFDSTIEAFQSFLKVPATVTGSGSHVRDCNDLKRVMIIVVVALLPTFLFGIYNTGYQHNLAAGTDMGFWQMVWYGFLKILPLYLVSYIVGLAIEFASAQIRRHQVNEGYLVTGMIIPLIVPIEIPLWMLAIAVAFAVIIGKEVFGGTGMNIWNPALIARAFLFFAYPAHMSGDKVWVAGVDGYSGATPLAEASAGNVADLPSALDMFIGLIPGCPGETSTIAILIGAAILIFTGVASWKIMVSSVAGALVIGYLCNWIAPSPDSYLAFPAWEHLLMGGFAFGTVFMATDPVTSAQTEAGKWIYGFLVGAFTIIIRLFNPGYPEGMMLSILLMNTFAPLIDYCVVQRNIKRRLNRAQIN